MKGEGGWGVTIKGGEGRGSPGRGGGHHKGGGGVTTKGGVTSQHPKLRRGVMMAFIEGGTPQELMGWGYPKGEGGGGRMRGGLTAAACRLRCAGGAKLSAPTQAAPLPPPAAQSASRAPAPKASSNLKGHRGVKTPPLPPFPPPEHL